MTGVFHGSHQIWCVQETFESSVAELQSVVEVLESQGQGAARAEEKALMLEARPGDTFKILNTEDVHIYKRCFSANGEVIMQFRTNNRIEKVV